MAKKGQIYAVDILTANGKPTGSTFMATPPREKAMVKQGRSATWDAAQEGRQLEVTNIVVIDGKRHKVCMADLKSGSRFSSALREVERYELSDDEHLGRS
jgi:hypothetical protein